MHNDSCYFFNNGPEKFYQDNHFVSCGSSKPGGFAQCCQPGTYCLSDGICKFDTEPDLVPKKNSLYYAGLCTDPSGKAEVCRHECFTSDTYYYIKWLGDSWQCCYGPERGEGDCTDPRGESFSAPAPGQLTTSTFIVNPSVAASVMATGVPIPVSLAGVTNSAALESYVTHALANGNTPTWFKSMPTAVQTYYVEPTFLGLQSSTITSSPTGRPSNTLASGANANNGSGNNDGGDLGVKVGVPVAIVVVLLILAALGFFLWRRRKNQKSRQSSKQDDDDTVVEGVSPKERSDLYGSFGKSELPYSPATTHSPVTAYSPTSGYSPTNGYSPTTAYLPVEKGSHLNQVIHPALVPAAELESPVRATELADTSSLHQRAELLASTTPAKP